MGVLHYPWCLGTASSSNWFIGIPSSCINSNIFHLNGMWTPQSKWVVRFLPHPQPPHLIALNTSPQIINLPTSISLGTHPVVFDTNRIRLKNSIKFASIETNQSIFYSYNRLREYHIHTRTQWESERERETLLSCSWYMDRLAFSDVLESNSWPTLDWWDKAIFFIFYWMVWYKATMTIKFKECKNTSS